VTNQRKVKTMIAIVIETLWYIRATMEWCMNKKCLKISIIKMGIIHNTQGFSFGKQELNTRLLRYGN